MITVELCAGTAITTLRALGYRERALTGYMGGKQRWAAALAASAFGAEIPDVAVLVDAGPWGDTWRTLVAPGGVAGVAARLRDLDTRGPLTALWRELVTEAPPDDPHERAAQYLCLQARSASCIPIWWDGVSWVSPTGSRVECHGSRKPPGANRRIKGGSGLIRIATLAERVEALRALPLDRIRVVHGRVEDVEPIPGARVLFDPPYLGAPRYAATLPRADVLAVAERWAAVAARVTVCEAAGLDLPGWDRHRLALREWVTSWRAPAPRAQLALWEAA